MESLDAAPVGFMDDLLNFSSDIGEEEEEDDDESSKFTRTLTALPMSLFSSRDVKTSGIVEEEELEWISNKDAFPMVESFVDLMPSHHRPSSIANHQSPVSVLENSTGSFTSNTSNTNTSSGSNGRSGVTTAIVSLPSSFNIPGKARSGKRKRRRKEVFSGQQWRCWPSKETVKVSRSRGGGAKQSSTLGRKCLHCQTEKTPQWRAGPMGPKTLCNACGVRYKSGRLVPEYRPASSPTFLSEVHSNSHRKIVEMRKQKQLSIG